MSLYGTSILKDIASDLHVAKSRLSSLLDAGGHDDDDLAAVYLKISEAYSLVNSLIDDGNAAGGRNK